MLILHYSAEPEGGEMAPDRSGLQAPVTKLSRWWPFGVAILQWHNGGIFSLRLKQDQIGTSCVTFGQN